MRFVGLLMVAGVIGFSHSAEGQEQDLDGGQGVIWVEGGVDSEVPENAIRVRVGDGRPLCRGTLAEDQGLENFWRDIGVVNYKEEGKCHTLRGKKELRLQKNFWYLVPAESDRELWIKKAHAYKERADKAEERVKDIRRDWRDERSEWVAQLRESRRQLKEAKQGMFSEAEVLETVSQALSAGHAEVYSVVGRLLREQREQE